MEENNNEKFSINREELKNETVETAKKIKETVKETNIKEETKATKNIIIEILKNTLEKINEIANDNTLKFFKTAIFLIIVWVISVFINSTYKTIYLFGFSRVFGNILQVLKAILAPVIGIIIYSIIVIVMNKNNKRTLTTIISTITITQIPLIISSVVSLLKIIANGISIFVTPFAKLCSIIAIVLRYFGFKYLFREEEKTFFKKYIIIQTIYYLAYIIIGTLGIYIV